ncbi:MAG: hypothetical protein ACTSRS_04330 [Candidatus Helarchaeota archaeon]
MKTWAKVLIVIAVLASGTISLLLAPLLPTSSVGTKNVPYDGGVITQINLVADVDVANIRIEYANSSTADLINVTWDLSVRYSVLVPPPTIQISWTNYSIGTTLTAIFRVQFIGLLLSAGLFSNIYITINPLLSSNLSVITTTGNINLNTTNSQNPIFQDVNLTTSTGILLADFIEGTTIQGEINIQTTTGNSELTIAKNAVINGTLTAKTTTGWNFVTLANNVSLFNNFLIQTSTGKITLFLNNSQLNSKALTGSLTTTNGNIKATIAQRVDSNGNLTLIMNSDTGNLRLILDLNAAGSIQSTVSPTTSTGLITGTLAGYSTGPGPRISTNTPQPYSIDANLTTNTGNIILEGGYS